MAYNEWLADRIRLFFQQQKVDAKEKRMMGGLTFMVNDKMCVGVLQNDLMARIDPEKYEEALTKAGCREMNFTGRSMKGFVFVGPEGTDLDKDLETWLNMALEFNPQAKSSKKSKKQ
jgi:TfoX/Sxy family transcriptional regulator of competence genes